MSAPINSLTLLVPAAIVSASLLGSGHCVAMCGGLTMMVGQSKRAALFYHLGRLLGYVSLGAAFGGFGKAVLTSSTFEFLPWVTTVFMSALLLFLGIRHLRGKPLHLELPRALTSLYPKLLKPSRGAFSMGILSCLLPCGWLYSFVLAAAALQSIGAGALSLALFWVGTLPALTFAPLLLQRLLRPLGTLAPKLSGTLLIIAAMGTIGLRAAGLRTTAPGSPLQGSCPMHDSAQ